MKREINPWIKKSIERANQKGYLDHLFEVYPIRPESMREINETAWKSVKIAFNAKDSISLLKNLLKLPLFPLKDSYIAYLKRDKEALERNPATAKRLADRLYAMGLTAIRARASEPKETNRQIGPLFKHWINDGSLGIKPVPLEEFLSTKKDAILEASDRGMMAFAREHLNYRHTKGLDFIGRFNGKYVIGEAKFLTDFGGHQNAQFNDAIATIKVKNVNAIKVAILDGVLYIKGKNKMYKDITGKLKNQNIMSALVLKEFLEHI
jgi:hypothetical protein